MKPCKHGNTWNCQSCEIEHLKCVIKEYKEENKRYKDTLTSIYEIIGYEEGNLVDAIINTVDKALRGR